MILSTLVTCWQLKKGLRDFHFKLHLFAWTVSTSSLYFYDTDDDKASGKTDLRRTEKEKTHAVVAPCSEALAYQVSVDVTDFLNRAFVNYRLHAGRLTLDPAASRTERTTPIVSRLQWPTLTALYKQNNRERRNKNPKNW